MKKKAQKKGFTLIELVIYIGIASLVIVTATELAVSATRAQTKSQELHEIHMNARLVMNQVALNIKEAEDVFIGLSTFETNPGVIVLDYPGSGTDVIIDTYEKDITIGGQIVTIRKLRIKEGSSDYIDLTNDKIEVINFFLTDMTRDDEPDNINVQLTLGTNDSDISTETSVSLRQ